MSGVWVWIDHHDNQIAAISLEALGVARRVADELSQTVTALVFGDGVAGVADAAFDHGADAVIGCDDETFAVFRVEAAGATGSTTGR